MVLRRARNFPQLRQGLGRSRGLLEALNSVTVLSNIPTVLVDSVPLTGGCKLREWKAEMKAYV